MVRSERADVAHSQLRGLCCGRIVQTLKFSCRKRAGRVNSRLFRDYYSIRILCSEKRQKGNNFIVKCNIFRILFDFCVLYNDYCVLYKSHPL